MARPKKKGLSYFPLDCDIFDDDKIFDVQNEYGPLGEVIYIRLLCLVYKNGYYYRFESLDKLAAMLIKSIGNSWARDKKTVSEVILYLAKCNLFSSELMRDNVITSRSIQARYLKANERSLSKIEEFNLLEKNNGQEGVVTVPQNQVNATEIPINVAKIPINVAETLLKESKENKSKGNESSSADSPSAPVPDPKKQLIETYGVENVAEYEQRFDNWKAKRGGNVKIDKYSTIAKWLKEDGVTKPNNSNSSFDVDETTKAIFIARYGKLQGE